MASWLCKTRTVQDRDKPVGLGIGDVGQQIVSHGFIQRPIESWGTSWHATTPTHTMSVCGRKRAKKFGSGNSQTRKRLSKVRRVNNKLANATCWALCAETNGDKCYPGHMCIAVEPATVYYLHHSLHKRPILGCSALSSNCFKPLPVL